MKVLVLGGDGYLGWPTAMNLSMCGHEVLVVDNYLRRKLMQSEDVNPLFLNLNLHERIRLWEKVSGKLIHCQIGDLTDWDFTSQVFKNFMPDAIIHYAEQPSAPYSMLSRASADLTIKNNIGVTSNIIFATHEFCPDAQIIKLGTMGEYGTPNIDIEEGWIEIQHEGRTGRFLYPRQAGSLYHTTKIMDTDLLWFYVRNWGLRVTDLMQGPVYGVYTNESELDERLLTFLSYDELFGTVLNRFIVQAVLGYPLTVYGAGGQTRGFLNILDTLNCIRIAVENPAERGELRIFNQFTETFSVNDLASRVKNAGKILDINVEIKHIDNPRKELENHYYNPKQSGLIELGLEPHFLNDEIIVKIMKKVIENRNLVDLHKIFRGTKWV